MCNFESSGKDKFQACFYNKVLVYMNYTPLKKLKFLKFSLLFVCSVGTLMPSSIEAMPSGNPAFPAISVTENKKDPYFFQLCSTKNPFMTLIGNLRFGFSGDYIFSEDAAVKGVPVVTSVTTVGTGPNPVITSFTKNYDFNLNNSVVTSSGVFATMAFQDSSPGFFPLSDLSIILKLSGLKNYYRLPLNAYRDFTSSPLASESEVTDGIIEVQSNYGMCIEFGIKKILWKDGVTFIGLGFDYRKASSPIDYIIVHSKTNPEIYFDSTDGSLDYKEWATSFGITTYLNDFILPYISLSLGNSTRMIPEDCFKDLESQFTDLKFKVRSISNTSNVNLCTGLTCFMAENFYYNLEARWGYQRALNVALGLQF